MRGTNLSMLVGGVYLLLAVGAHGQTKEARSAEASEMKPVRSAEPAASDPESPATHGGGAASSLTVPQAGAQAIVPRLVRFTGLLRDITGKPLSGPLDVTFSLYNAEAGGEPLWFETQTVQADEQGRYTTLLGTMHSDGLPVDLFTSGEVRWWGCRWDQKRNNSRACCW